MRCANWTQTIPAPQICWHQSTWLGDRRCRLFPSHPVRMLRRQAPSTLSMSGQLHSLPRWEGCCLVTTGSLSAERGNFTRLTFNSPRYSLSDGQTVVRWLDVLLVRFWPDMQEIASAAS